MTRRDPHKAVEVFAPPHLRHIADEIASRAREQFEQLPTDALHRLLRHGEAIERAREEFARFLKRAGVKRSSEG
jgi:hypothetical protein